MINSSSKFDSSSSSSFKATTNENKTNNNIDSCSKIKENRTNQKYIQTNNKNDIFKLKCTILFVFSFLSFILIICFQENFKLQAHQRELIKLNEPKEIFPNCINQEHYQNPTFYFSISPSFRNIHFDRVYAKGDCWNKYLNENNLLSIDRIHYILHPLQCQKKFTGQVIRLLNDLSSSDGIIFYDVDTE